MSGCPELRLIHVDNEVRKLYYLDAGGTISNCVVNATNCDAFQPKIFCRREICDVIEKASIFSGRVKYKRGNKTGLRY